MQNHVLNSSNASAFTTFHLSQSASATSESPDLAGASASCANNDEVPPHIVHISFTYRYDLDMRTMSLSIRIGVTLGRQSLAKSDPPRTRQSPTSLKAFQQFQSCNLSLIFKRQVKSGSSHLRERLLITRKLPFSLPDCDLGPSILGTLPTCAWLWGCDETEHLVMDKQL